MIDDKVKILKSVAEKNRLRILEMLKNDTLCVCEITSILKLATSTVSNHLKVLREVGFIEEEKNGKWIYYKINRHPPNPINSAILEMLDLWLERDEEIKKDRIKLCCLEQNINK